MTESRLQRMLGRRMRAARVSMGMDQEGFAHELGMGDGEYQRIEAGKALPDLETLIYAARFTGKSLDFLLTGRPFDPDS